MQRIIRRRQLRGLLLHHRRHPATHPRRLVNRTAKWGEPPVNGVCRWCYERTASPKKRWHRYCLNYYWVASGQPPNEIQHTLCEICGNGADELDHRLAIEVARGLGREALLRAFVPGNLRWLCHECHRRKTRQDRILAKFVRNCGFDWQTARLLCKWQHAWIDAFLMPFSVAPPALVGRERIRTLRTGYWRSAEAG